MQMFEPYKLEKDSRLYHAVTESHVEAVYLKDTGVTYNGDLSHHKAYFTRQQHVAC